MKKNLLNFCLFAVLLLFCNRLFSQANPAIDSLKLLLSKAKHDSDIVNYQNKLSKLYEPDDSLTAITYLLKSQNIADKKGLYVFQIKTLYQAGLFFEQYGNTASAEDNYRKGLGIAIKNNDAQWMTYGYKNLFSIYKKGDIKRLQSIVDSGITAARKAGDKKNEGLLYNNLGNAQVFKNMNEAAMQNLLKALDIFKKTNDSASLILANLNLGNNYNHIKLYDKSIEYSKQAETIAKKLKNYKLLGKILVNLSSSYFYKSDFKTSIAYGKEIEDLYKQGLTDDANYGSALSNNGNSYIKQNQFPEAIVNLKNAITYLEKTGDYFNLAVNLVTLSEAYIKNQDYAEGEAVLQNALSIAKENNYEEIEEAALMNKSELLKRTGRYKEAYETLEQSYVIKDSLAARKNVKTIAELETRYNSLAKDKQISEQHASIQKKNLLLIISLTGVTLLIISAFAYYRNMKQREKVTVQRAIIKEQDEAAKAVVSAEENERTRMSQTLHDGLGQLLSAAKMNLQAVQENLQLNPQMTTAYNNALMLVDDSIKEMRSVSHQMVTNNVVKTGLANALKELIEKIDTNRLKVNLNVNGLLQNIDTDIQVVVYRIIQESINNVIKHAQADMLNIDLDIATANLTGRITDNGVGFDTSKPAKRNGIGLDNIATRIKFLKGKLDINSSPGKGTELSFQIPIAN